MKCKTIRLFCYIVALAVCLINTISFSTSQTLWTQNPTWQKQGNANWIFQQTMGAGTYIIVASAGSGGTINPSGNVAVTLGLSQTFTISANISYVILQVLIDGVSYGAITSYTFGNVQTNHTITVNFALLQHVPVTLHLLLGTDLIIKSGTTYHLMDGSYVGTSGTNIRVSEFWINGWFNYTVTNVGTQQIYYSAYAPQLVLIDGAPSTSYSWSSGVTTITTATVNVSILYVYYYITASSDTGSTINPSGTVIIVPATSQQFSFAPKSGCSLVQVLVDGSPVSTVSPYTFSNIEANHTISVFSTGPPQYPPGPIVVPVTPSNTSTATPHPQQVVGVQEPYFWLWIATTAAIVLIIGAVIVSKTHRRV